MSDHYATLPTVTLGTPLTASDLRRLAEVAFESAEVLDVLAHGAHLFSPRMAASLVCILGEDLTALATCLEVAHSTALDLELAE